MRQEALYNYFRSKAFHSTTPISVMIELLTKCNVRCEHCYLPSFVNPGISFEKMEKLLHELKNLGVVSVSFTGGEIFLRKDLFDLIAIARKLNMRVILLSNATLLTEEKVKKLSELYISEFSTTVFSMDERIHDSITKQEGSLKKVLKNLSYLKKYGIRVKVKTPIMKKNMTDFMNVKKFCDENGFSFFTSSLIFSKNDGDSKPKELRIHECDMVNVVKTIDKISRNDYLHADDIPCRALFYSFAIDCDGNVHPCNSFLYKVGNIYENSLKEIWYDSEGMNLIRSIRSSDLTQCTSCKYKSQCDRCPGMVYLENKDFLSCDQSAKSVAKIRLSNM